MPYNCIAANCTNVATDSITLFAFPRKPALRDEWTRLVRTTRPGWAGPSDYSRLCNDHFEPDQLESTPAFYKQFGINYFKKFALKPDAVPSIFPLSRQRRKSVKTETQRPRRLLHQDGPADDSLSAQPTGAEQERKAPTTRRLSLTVKLGYGEKRASLEKKKRKAIQAHRSWAQLTQLGGEDAGVPRSRRPKKIDRTSKTVGSATCDMKITQAYSLAQNTTSEPVQPNNTSANMEYEPGLSVFDVKSSSTQVKNFIDQLYGESQPREIVLEQTEISIADIFDSTSTFLGSASYQLQNPPVEGGVPHNANNLQTSSSIVIQCLLCDKAFCNHTAFKAHASVKHGGVLNMTKGQHKLKIVKCVTCEKTFTEYSSLKKHIKNIHATNRSKWFACKYCQQLFRNLRTVKEHELGVHTNEMFFECKYCGQMFNSSYVFYEHVTTHTEKTTSSSSSSSSKNRKEQSASVKLVGRSTLSGKQTVGLTASRLLFLGRTKSKKPLDRSQSGPFQCKSCPSSFKLAHELLAHLTDHSGPAGMRTGVESKTKHNVPNILRR